jgi:hypothetical protein
MNIKQIAAILLAGLLFLGCNQPSGPKSRPDDNPGGNGGGGDYNPPGTETLTIGQTYKFTPSGTSGTVTYTSSNNSVAAVASDGTVTARGITTGGSNRFTAGPGTGTATITATWTGGSATLTVNTTTAAREDIMSLLPLKDQLGVHFEMVGNIFNPADITGSGSNARMNNARLTHHFNVLTHENHMKPDNLSSGYNTVANTHTRNNAGFAQADNMINAARAANIDVIGHTLLWHSKIPQWQRGMGSSTKEVALTAMKTYITDVVTHFKGKIHTWDVLNEVFPDGVSATED